MWKILDEIIVLYLKNHCFGDGGGRVQLHEVGIVVENQGHMVAIDIILVFQNRE